MQSADIVLLAKQDKNKRNELINANHNFISSCASKTVGRYIDKSDDLFSEALIAFNDAIDNFDVKKGNFFSFAKVCIHNRLNAYLRKQNRHNNVIPFSSLSKENDNGEDVAFEIEDINSNINDTALEICSLKKELEHFDINFFDLPSASPKSTKTRNACVEIVSYITEEKELLKYLYEKKHLPSKILLENLKVNNKILERHRKYIIMGVLITNGKYEIMLEYFDSGRCRE